MQFFDLSGVKSLWAAIKKETAAAKTTVEGMADSETNAVVLVSEVDGASDGHVQYNVALKNVASNASVTAAKEALYGGTIPTSDALTLTSLDTAISNLSTASEVTVEKLTTAEDGYLSSYAVKQNGVQVGATINIPKDFLIKSGQVREATAADTGIEEGTKVLDFVVNVQEGTATDSHIVIPVSDLVDVYTGEKAIEVSDANVISLKLSGTTENFLTVENDGLKLSGVQTAINTAKSEVIGNAETDTADSNTIAGAKKYADEAVEAVAGDYATAAQGEKADSALQSIAKSGDYINVTEKANNSQTVSLTVQTVSGASDSAKGLAEASDVKSYVDTAVSNKNVSASGETGDSALVTASAEDNAVTVASTTKLQNAVASAESALQGVKVDNVALTPDANHVVSIDLTGKTDKVSEATSGNFAGLDSNGNLTDSGKKAADFATAEQGTKADSAIQSVTGETALTGDSANNDFVSVAAETANNAVTISSKVKVQAVATASETLDGLATAKDVKTYVDGEVTTLVGGASGTGNTLKKLEDRLASLEGEGEGSVADQIESAVNALDSSIVSKGTTSGDNIAAVDSAVDAETQTAQYFLTGATITDGKLSAGTSVKIEGIPAATLDAIFNSSTSE